MLQDIAKRWCFFSVNDTGLLRSALNVVPSFFSFCLNHVHVIYVNLIFVAFFFSSATKWKNCTVVIGPLTPWQLTVIQWGWRCSHADHVCYLDDDWCCNARTGLGHMTNHEIFAYKTTLLSAISYFFWGCCFGDGGATFLVFDYLKLHGANAQNTYRRTHKSYCSRPIHTKRCYWAVFLERIEIGKSTLN